MGQKFNTVGFIKMTLLTVLVYVSTYIVIPLPFTPTSLMAQTLVVSPIALLLTPRQAAFTMVVYILPGLTGLPVFPGDMSGPGGPFDLTGGYIMSWIPAIMLMSRLRGKHYSFKWYYPVTTLVGMPVTYLIGSACVKLITGMDWAAALTAVVISFVPSDISKCFAVALTAKSVQISLPSAQRAR